MTYLITGGCGFVGTNIAATLLRREEAVCVFDDLSREGSEANLAWLRTLGPIRFVRGDVRDRAAVDATLRTCAPHVVFHLAGQVAMTTSLHDPRRDFEVNVLGTLNVLEAVRAHAGAASVVYASTNKVYGNLEHLDLVEETRRYRPRRDTNGVDESATLAFATPYGCSKGAADQYVLDYAHTYGLATVVLRHSTIYGGRQFATFDQGWIGWFCRQALATLADPARPPFTISGDGKQVRDLLHVSDAVRCYLDAAERIADCRGEAFNIGGGMAQSMSLLELFAHLESELGVSLAYERLPWRASDQKFFVADIAKARATFGWSPRVDSVAGIASVLAWERSQAATLAAASTGSVSR